MGLIRADGVVWVVVLVVGTVWCRTSVVTLSTPTTTTTTTTLPSNMTPFTMAPGQKINYTLELMNNGPVVLDADITFIARLRDQKGKIAQSKEFQYDWNNNADKQFMTAKGDLEYSYVRPFRSFSTRPGTWVMTVAVYSGEKYGDMINFGSMKFVLTETLNGFLHPHQPLEYQRNKDIFAAERKIELYANLTDSFSRAKPFQLKPPSYQFFWYKDNELLQSTEIPYYNLTIESEGNFTIQTEVYAFFNEPQAFLHNTSLKMLKVDFCSEKSLRSFNSVERKKKIRHTVDNKCGMFTHRLTVKKPVKSVEIRGSRSAALGEYIVVNVTCKGSYPTSLCWNMTALNTSEPSLNATCPPNDFTNTCNHRVRIKMTQLGWKTIWFTVYNDVSYMSMPFNVYAYDPNTVNVPALTIPVVFCTLGLVVIVIGAVYLNRLRKKPVIEIADFDFHPSVSTEYTTNIFSRLANKVKIVWLSNTHSNRQKNPAFQKTTAKQYGATDLHESL